MTMLFFISEMAPTLLLDLARIIRGVRRWTDHAEINRRRLVKRGVGGGRGGILSSSPASCSPNPCIGSNDGGRLEVEFLDIILTQDSSHLLQAIYIPFYWWILQKTIMNRIL